MMRSSHTQRAFTLLALLMLVFAGTAVGTILIKLIVDGMYLQRIVAQHANRTAVTDSLAQRLRQDAVAAVAFQWNGDALILLSPSREGTTQSALDRAITYVIGADAVVRTVDGAETARWQYDRLTFVARVEEAPRGALLHLDFIEQPPPRATRMPPRTFVTTIQLPPQPSGPQPAAEKRP